MNNKVQESLKSYITTYGPDAIRDVKRCEGFLKDACGNNKKELFALVSAIRENLPQRLVKASKDNHPIEYEIYRCVEHLTEMLGFQQEVAVWTVKTWAYALSLEYKENAITKSEITEPATSTIEAENGQNKGAGQDHDTELDENTVKLVDESGKEHDFEIIMTLEMDDKDYAILLPLDADEDDEGYVFRMDADKDDADQLILVAVEDNDEFDKVSSAYEAMLVEMDSI